MPKSSEEPSSGTLIVVATVHLDSQWRWTIRDSIAEFLPRTLRENFALFESHPHYVLSFEGAFRYMLAREYYPIEYEELKRWCAAGRWLPAGAMLDAPDVNAVAPESLIRHILYGNGYFEREFGVRSRDIFLPDCFGFGHALPSVAAHCGLRSFSTSKLIKWKAPGKIPLDIGRWRGPDGAEILAVLQPGGYGEGIDDDLSKSTQWEERLLRTGEQCGVAVGMRYFGTGDRGGSPDRESLDRLEESIAGDGPIEVVCAASDAIQDRFDAAALSRLPVHDDEILLPTHGTGGWTSQAALKRWNRKNEQLAAAAERAALAADWLGGLAYPRQRINEGWLRFLWHQMHDDLPGTSIPAAYDITWNDQAVAANLFASVLGDAIGTVAGALDSDTDGLPLLVYNPLGCEREDVVEAQMPRADLPPGALAARAPDGELRPVQVLGEGATAHILFLAAAKPVSFAVWEIVAAEPAEPVPIEVATDQIENHRYRVDIGPGGDIEQVYDKLLDRDLLRSPLRLELLVDRSMRWPAWEIRPETILDGRVEPVTAPATIEVIEAGPVRGAIRVVRRFNGSELRQVIRLTDGDGGNRLEIVNELDWGTRARLLKAAFPLAAANPLATYDLGIGAIERDNNTVERYEVPAQQWGEITDAEGEFGTAILNDCLYGWDKPADHELRLSLARSPSSLRKYPHQRTQDLGRHDFTYGLLGHRGVEDRSMVCHQAERLNQPLLAWAIGRSHTGGGRQISLLDPGSPDIALAALKKAENNQGWVVRLRELARRPATARLDGDAPITGTKRLTGDERPHPGPAAVDRQIPLGAWGIETIGVEIAPPPRALERPDQTVIDLPWDRRATSFNGGDEVDFDGRGASLPGELFPRELALGEVDFRFGPADRANALACNQQRIELPEGCRRLWLVAATIGPARTVDFDIDGTAHGLDIASWTGWLAERPQPPRWRGLRSARPGRMTRDELAWLGTHRHRWRRGTVEDEPYVFCYLYRYAIDVDAGCRSLRLPNAPRVHLFAATVSTADTPRPRALQPLYGSQRPGFPKARTPGDRRGA